MDFLTHLALSARMIGDVAHAFLNPCCASHGAGRQRRSELVGGLVDEGGLDEEVVTSRTEPRELGPAAVTAPR